MENSLLFIFDEIWPKTMYYSTWSLAQFLATLKLIKHPLTRSCQNPVGSPAFHTTICSFPYCDILIPILYTCRFLHCWVYEGLCIVGFGLERNEIILERRGEERGEKGKAIVSVR